jgi:hypothetical protein
MNITDNFENIVGEFGIQLIDTNTNKVIQEYKEKNKIMSKIYWWNSLLIYGNRNNFRPSIDDFIIHSIALGSDGVDTNGVPKKIDVHRKNLFSEENFWNGSSDLKRSYVYQATWKQPEKNEEHYAFKTDEGTTIPDVTKYRGPAFNDEKYKDAGLFIKRSYVNSILHQEFYLGKFAGNGKHDWGYAEYSEAALYMKRGATENGSSLGSIFSMKTFPKMKKTPSCVIKINWDIHFNPGK